MLNTTVVPLGEYCYFALVYVIFRFLNTSSHLMPQMLLPKTAENLPKYVNIESKVGG